MIYLTWTLRVLVFEGGNTNTFAGDIIVAIQYALTQRFAILCHAGFQVIVIRCILK